MIYVKHPKFPRKLKKALTNHSWFCRRDNKYRNLLLNEDSIAFRIQMWWWMSTEADRGYIPEKEITKHRLFRVVGETLSERATRLLS